MKKTNATIKQVYEEQKKEQKDILTGVCDVISVWETESTYTDIIITLAKIDKAEKAKYNSLRWQGRLKALETLF